MKYVSCPQCGGRLMEGEKGSHVVIKCVKCNGLFDVYINEDRIEIKLKQKTQNEMQKP